MAIPTVRGGKSQGVAVSEEVFDKLAVTGDSQIGSAAATLVSFHGAAAVAQAVICSAAVTVVTAGAASTADFTTLVAAVNAMRTLLINKGLMAAS